MKKLLGNEYDKHALPWWILQFIKKIYPKFCWAELVRWNLGLACSEHDIWDLLHPADSGMLVGGCRELVKEMGHGWCGCCRR